MKKIRKIMLLSFFLLQAMAFNAYSQCNNVSISATSVAATCENNGIITVTVSGTDASNLRLADAQIRLVSSAHTFDWSVWSGTGATKTFTSAPPGNYTVFFRAFCTANQEITTATISTTVNVGGTYRPPGMSASMTRKTMNCKPTGQAALTLSNGLAPFSVSLVSFPVNASNPTDPNTNYLGAAQFNNVAAGAFYIEDMVAGNYTIQVRDACGYQMERTITMQALSQDVPVTLYAAMQRTNSSDDCRSVTPYTYSVQGADWDYYWQNSSRYYEYAYVVNCGTPTTWTPLPDGTASTPYSGKNPSFTLPTTYAAWCASGQTLCSYIQPIGCSSQRRSVTHTFTNYVCNFVNGGVTTVFSTMQTNLGTTCDKVKLAATVSSTWAFCYPATWTIAPSNNLSNIITQGQLTATGLTLLTAANSPDFDRGVNYTITITDSENRVFTYGWEPAMPQSKNFNYSSSYLANGYYCNTSTTTPIGARYFYLSVAAGTVNSTENRIMPGTTIRYVSGPQDLAMGPVGTVYTVPEGYTTSGFYPNSPVYTSSSNGTKIMNAGSYVFEITSPTPCDGESRTITIPVGNYFDPDQEAFVTKHPDCNGVKVTLNAPLKLIDRPGGTQTNATATWFKILSGPAGVPINTSAYQAFTSTGAPTTTNNTLLLPAPGTYVIGISNSSSFNSCSSNGAIVTTTVVIEDTDRFRIIPEETSAYYCEGTSGNIITAARNGIGTYTYTITAEGSSTVLATNQTGIFHNIGVAGGRYNIRAVDGCNTVVNMVVTMLDLRDSYITYTINDGVFCIGQEISLNSIALGPTTYSWTGPGGFTSTEMRPRPIAGTFPAGRYEVIVQPANCPGMKTGYLDITLSEPPVSPTVANPNLTACQLTGGTIDVVTAGGVNPLPGNTLRWYSGPTTPTPMAASPTAVSIAAVGSTTFYVVQVTSAGCESPRVPVTLNVVSNGTAPMVSISRSSACVGDTDIQLSAVPMGALLWGGSAHATEPITVPTITSSAGPLIVYFRTDGSVVRAGSTTNITISCVGGSGGPGGTYAPPQTGVTSIFTCNGTLSTAVTGNYLNNNNGYLVINPSTPGARVSLGGTLTVERCCDWIAIYDGAASTGTWISNNPSVATVNPTTGAVTTVAPGTVTFSYISAGSCIATTTALTVSGTGVSTGISYNQPFCGNVSTAQLPTVTGNQGGTFTVSPSTGLTINSSTGAITPSSSTAGTYTVTYTFTGVSCGGGNTASTTVQIIGVPTLTGFSYPNSGSMSQTQGTQSPTITGTGTFAPPNGSFTAFPAGLTINSSTGVITPSSSAIGTYTVVYTLPDQGCGVVTRTTTVTLIACNSVTISYSGLTNPVCASGIPNGNNSYTATLTSVPSGLAKNAGTWTVSPANSNLTITTNGNANNFGNISVRNGLPAGVYTITFTPTNSAYCTATYTYTVYGAPSITAFSYGTVSTFCVLNEGEIIPSVSGANLQGGTYSSTAGLVINSTTGAINPSESTPGTYTVTFAVAGQGGCANASRTASVTILGDQSLNELTTIVYPNDPYCNNITTSQPVTITGVTGGIFSVCTEEGGQSGLYLNTTNGFVTPNLSEPGNYTIYYETGCNSSPIATGVTILQAPSATIRYNNTATPTFCTNDPATYPVALTGQGAFTGGAFTVSPTTGLSIDATGTIMPSASTTGTYTVTYNVSANGCAATPATATVIIAAILAQPSTITGTATGAVCQNTTGLTLTVTNVTGTTYTWVLPTGWTQTGGTTTNSITVTAGATAGSGTVTVTPSNTCGEGTPRTITITALPRSTGEANITVNPPTICNGQSVNLTTLVTGAPGVTNPVYRWFSSATTNTALTGAGLTVSPTSNTTYYAAVSGDNFCEGENNATGRKAVLVTVNPNLTPAFAFGTALDYYIGASPATLLTVSENGIHGIWSPSAISTVAAGQAVYTFTPNAGQCASGTTLVVTTTAMSRMVDTIVWTNAAGCGKWSNAHNWILEDGSSLGIYNFTLTDDVTVIIPEPGRILPHGKIVEGGLYSEMTDGLGNVFHSSEKRAHKIIVEAGASLLMEPIEGKYDVLETALKVTDRSNSANSWLMVGPNVLPYGRTMVSGDYFLNNQPHVYMSPMVVNESTGTAEWNSSFPHLNVPIHQDSAYAIKVPNQYGIFKFPANDFYSGDLAGYFDFPARDEAKMNAGTEPVYIWFKEARAQSDNPITFKVEADKWVRMSNVFLAKISVGKFLAKYPGSQIAVWNGTNFVTTTNPDHYIKPMEAFFVYNGGSGTITLVESEVCDINMVEYRAARSAFVEPEIVITASAANGGISQATFKYDSEGRDISNLFKLFIGKEPDTGDHVSDIFSYTGSNNYQGQAFTNKNAQFDLGINMAKAKEVTFTVTGVEEFEEAYLDDKALGISYNLKTQAVPPVDLIAGRNKDRFVLRLVAFGGIEDPYTDPERGNSGGTTDINVSDVAEKGLKIYTEDHRHVVVSAPSGQVITAVSIVDMAGRVVNIKPAADSYARIDMGNYPAGIYTVKATTNNETKTVKIAIK